MEQHLPINHPLRPFWRVLAFLAGGYVLVFGTVGYLQTRGLDTYAQPSDTDLPTVLGLHANPAFSMLSIGVGAVVVLGTLVGRNIDRVINLIAGSIFILASMAALLVLRTDVNYLGFGMATCIASSILGLIMATAGLYGKVGSTTQQHAVEVEKHGEVVHD